MQPIHLDDQLYQESQRRAAEAGFPNVDAYVANVVQQDLHEETEDFEHLFTPERLAHIARAAAQIDAGQGLTLEQANAELAKRADGFKTFSTEQYQQRLETGDLRWL